MAAALGIKSVSIFGPVDELVYGPYPPSANHVVIKRDIPCRPCYRNFKFWGCDNDRACIKPIGVDEVFEAVRRIW
jgi:ADP-heptose:LPS heptosyltransferase